MPIKKEEDEPFSAPPWIVTFSDMIGLLTSFFIMLLTYSSKDVAKFRKLHGALLGEFGLLGDPNCPDYDAFLTPPEALLNKARNDGLRHQRDDLEMLTEGTRTLVQKGELGDRVQFDQLDDGLRVRIQVTGTFAEGSSQLTPELDHALGEIADLLRLHRCKVIVVGHCWDEGPAAATEEARLALSQMRATEAALFLVKTGHVNLDRIGIAARGAHEPLANGSTAHPLAAAMNRRVEILVLADA